MVVWIDPYRFASASGPEFTDDFNRANSASLGSDWDQSELGAGALSILSSQMAAATSNTVNFARVTQAMSSVDMYAQCIFGSVTASEAVGIIIRSASSLNPGTYYILQYDPTNKWRIRRVVSGTATTIATDTAGISGTPNVYRFEISGTSLVGKLNGTSFISATDSTITTGDYVGIRLDNASNNLTTIDDFEAGTV